MSRRMLLGVLLLSSTISASSSVAIAAPAPYEINAVLSLTGGAAFLGNQEQRSLSLLESIVNRNGGIRGRRIKFVVQDDGSSPQQALQLVSGLLTKAAPIVIGPSQNATCSAVVPVVSAKGPVVYCLSPSIRPTADGYVFSTSVSTRDFMRAIFRYLRAGGVRKIALISSTDSTGQDGARTVDETAALAENKTISVVAKESFAPNDITVAAQMSRIRSSGAEALIAWTTGSPFQTVTRSFIEAGLEVPFIGGSGNMTYAQMQQLASFLPKKLLFAGPRYLAYDRVRPGPLRDVQSVFLRSYGAGANKPDYAQGLAWDPALLFIAALQHLGTDASAEQIRTYLTSLHGFVGINGLYDFRSGDMRGLGAGAAVVFRWDAQKRTWVEVSEPGGAPL
jgi:branched-chain amino acid transport system substrate-binding protein